MATRVLIREFAGSDHTAAVKEVSAEMFDLPEVGSRYWRGGLPYTVRGIAEGDPAVVDLVLDRARSQEVDQERLGHHSSAFTMDTPPMRRRFLPRIRLHDLRHTHPGLLVQAGVPRRSSRSAWGTTLPPSPWTPTPMALPALQAEAAQRLSDLIHRA